AYRCHLHHEHLLSFPTRRSSDLNLDQALDVELNLTPEVTLDAVVAAHVIADRLDLSFSQILDARVRVDTRPAQNLVRPGAANSRSEEHTSELQSRENLVCRLLLA